jgi:hypothetical protein
MQMLSQVGYGQLNGNVEVAHRPAASFSWSRVYRVHPSVRGVALAVAMVGIVAPLLACVSNGSGLPGCSPGLEPDRGHSPGLEPD